jgi:transcriptional regulator with GAF, ATPase, and Fis domain
LEVNCAALTETLLETELFGHVKGSFSGATCDRRGKFVAASGGTLFLDEIGEMSKASQAKILRALQEKKVTPVGSEKAVTYNARVIAATNQNLAQGVELGEFREDLYYRLCGIEIPMPPLRERVEDIHLLSMYFLNKAVAEQKQQNQEQHPPLLAKEALEMLMAFSWPGNVRQLEQALFAAVAICEGGEIQPSDFPAWLQKAMKTELSEPVSRPTATHHPKELAGSSESDELRARYLKALNSTKYPGTGRWNLSAAARELHIPRKTFIYRVKKLGVIKSP